MRKFQSIAIVSSAAALALGMLLAPPASADFNYAPGLPAPTAGVPNNPPKAAPVTEDVVLVRESVAARTEPIDVKRSPSSRIGRAPFPTPETKVGRPVALVTQGLIPGTTYVVQIKRKGGTYGTLGSMVATTTGQGTLPVFRPTSKGVYILAIIDQKTGTTTYIKVRVE